MILSVTAGMLGTYLLSVRVSMGLGTCDKWIFEYIGKMAERVLQMVTISINSLKA